MNQYLFEAKTFEQAYTKAFESLLTVIAEDNRPYEYQTIKVECEGGSISTFKEACMPK